MAFGQFAEFCRSLPWRTVPPDPALPPIGSDIATLEGEVVTAYDRAEAAARPPFINVNVTIKLARQLDGDGHRAAALTLQQQYGDSLRIVAFAVDSKTEDVRKLTAAIGPRYHVVMGTSDVLEPFGAVAAVPKMFLFDRSGARAAVFYGAPPDLHQQIESRLKRLQQ